MSFRAWLQLIRPPNLVTVPGDPMAGFLLAAVSFGGLENVNLWMALPCMVSSLLLYISGLMLNDYADTKEDARLRSDRPIPSGQVSGKAVLSIGIGLGVAGIAAAGIAGRLPMMVAVCLAVLVLLYNSVARLVRPVGTLTLGLCRGLSVALGAAAAGGITPLVLLAVLGVAFYIMEVSNVAVFEAEGKLLKGARWFPALVLMVLFVVIHYRLGELRPVSIVLALGAFAWALGCAARLGEAKGADDISKEVGKLLRGQLLVQASFCAIAGRHGLAASACLMLMWPVGILLGRKYYAS